MVSKAAVRPASIRASMKVCVRPASIRACFISSVKGPVGPGDGSCGSGGVGSGSGGGAGDEGGSPIVVPSSFMP